MAGMALVLQRAAISAKMSMALLILLHLFQVPLTAGGSIPAMPMAVIGQQSRVQTLLAPFLLTLLPSPKPALVRALSIPILRASTAVLIVLNPILPVLPSIWLLQPFPVPLSPAGQARVQEQEFAQFP